MKNPNPAKLLLPYGLLAVALFCMQPIVVILAQEEGSQAQTAERNAMLNAAYEITATDLINIDVVGEEELKKDLRVSASGSITFPYIGKVEVAGLSVVDVEARVRDKLAKDYIIDPQVIVTVKEYRRRFVTVIGEVNEPGPVEFLTEQPLNVVEAIGLAGGPTKLAKDRIQLTRDGEVLELSLDDLRRSSDLEGIPLLEHGDIIWVPESTF